MTYEFGLHRLPVMTVLAIRERVDEAAFPAFLGSAFPELFTHTEAHAAEVTGEPFVIYHAFGPDGIDAEVCVPVAGRTPSAGRITAHQLPAVTVVRTLHIGPYEALGEAYAALDRWAGDHGYHVAGPHRERYLTGPDTATADQRTEVDMPVVPVDVADPTEPLPVG